MPASGRVLFASARRESKAVTLIDIMLLGAENAET